MYQALPYECCVVILFVLLRSPTSLLLLYALLSMIDAKWGRVWEKILIKSVTWKSGLASEAVTRVLEQLE